MKRKKLLPKHHTGKLTHRHHTSYGLLVFVIGFAFAPLMVISRSVAAQSADPVSGSNGVYAVVPAPLPDSAPIIKTVINGQVFTTTEPVSIGGSCPADSIIKVYKNQVMAGSDLCENRSFAVDVDLFVGGNSIIARPYNVNNKAGPDSEPVNVKLDLGVTGNVAVGALNGASDQLFLTSDTYFAGVRTKEPLKWALILSNGQSPYAVSVSWGDGKTDLISRGEAGTFTVEHTYDEPGSGYRNSYDVIARATDQQGNKSLLHLVSIVSSDQPSVVSSVKAGYKWSGALRIAWQLMLVGGAIIVGFWVGEKYEIRVLKKKYNIV